jgi:hypothetical protein
MQLYGLPFHLDGHELPPYFNLENESGEYDPGDSYRKWPDYWDITLVGLHGDLVRAHLDARQDAIRTWLACQEEQGLEKLVEPDVTPENLVAFHEEDSHQSDAYMCWTTSASS